MNAMTNSVDQVHGNTASGHLPGGAAPTLMNPTHDTMNTLSIMAGREQKDGMPGHQDLTKQMITALQRKPEASPHIDMGGKDFRPADLTSQFNPKMDQPTHLYSGSGDDMVIIV